MKLQTVRWLSMAILALGHITAAQASHDGAQIEPLKPSLSTQELSSFAAGCVLAIVARARRDYYARAAQLGNANPPHFPEQQVTASLAPMCSCIGLRLASPIERLVSSIRAL